MDKVRWTEKYILRIRNQKLSIELTSTNFTTNLNLATQYSLYKLSREAVEPLVTPK